MELIPGYAWSLASLHHRHRLWDASGDLPSSFPLFHRQDVAVAGRFSAWAVGSAHTPLCLSPGSSHCCLSSSHRAPSAYLTGRDSPCRPSISCRAEATAVTGTSIQPRGSDWTMMAPLRSLYAGQWVKLICGASFEDVVDVRNLSLVYTLAGVDCIDCAADAATVAATVEGINAALELGRREGTDSPGLTRPWVMVSVSDDEDPHFRKAAFDPALCPADCPRPCARVCPTDAITFPGAPQASDSVSSSGAPKDGGQPLGGSGIPVLAERGQSLGGGVLAERCYGCGRCLSACPLRLIQAESHVRRVEDLQTLLQTPSVDAIEIHTLPGHLEKFKELWDSIGEQAGMLKLVAVSTPDQGSEMDRVLSQMYTTMQPQLISPCVNLWQLDGKPMSGDLGPATARAAVRLALKVLGLPAMPPGFIQLAGGTNACTYDAMRTAGIWGNGAFQRTDEEGEVRVLSSRPGEGMEANGRSVRGATVKGPSGSGGHGKEEDGPPQGFPVAGVAFGGSARALVSPVLRKLDARVEEDLVSGDHQFKGARIEEHPDLLQEALGLARRLLMPIKSRDMPM